MGITLRLVKGSELTFAEVDDNFKSLFYSASLSGSTLTLFAPSSSNSQSIDLSTISISVATGSFSGSFDGIGSGSFSGSFEGDGSGLTGVSATATNFANTNLTFDGNRLHDLNSNNLTLSGGEVIISSSLTTTGPILAKGEYQLIDPASGSVTIDWTSGSMFELNATDDITITLTGSYSGGDHKLLLKNTSTASAPSITWNDTNLFYNSFDLPSSVTQVSPYALDPDGFDVAAYANSLISDFVQQSDGKIVLVGSFTTVSGSTSNRIVRINTSGSVDSSFNVGDGFNQPASRIIQQTDGKFIVLGSFTQYSGSSSQYVARINTDGTLDTDFDINGGFNSLFSVQTFNPVGIGGNLVQQPDGKIVVVGNFTQYSGSTANRIVRITDSGSIDPDFTISGSGFAAGTAYNLALQTDGKIIVGGKNFTTYSGSSISNVLRINDSGSLDSSFNPGTVTVTGNITDIKIQDDDKIIIAGGSLSAYSGSSVNEFIRVNSDGTLDSDFNNNNTTDFASSNPLSIAIESGSGNIFTTVDVQFGSVSFYKFDNSGSLVRSVGNIGGGVLGQGFKFEFESGSNKILLGGNFNVNQGPGRFIRLVETPSGLKYSNYNIYYNGSYYFVDTNGASYIYETDPNIIG